MPKEQEREYLALLGLFMKASGQSTRIVTSDPDRSKDAEGLAVKFTAHSASVFYLARGTNIEDVPPVPIDFVDFASISTVARAAFEAFLTFHHVFVAPKSAELGEFRYWAWLLSGLCERQRFPATTPQHRKRLANEKRMIADLHKKLASNSEFTRLERKDKAHVKKGRWRLSGWKDLGNEVGLDELHASTIYGYLCGYAHSDSLSTLQIHAAKQREEQERLSRIAVTHTMIATANMVFLYCDVFPGGKNALAKDPEATQTAIIWRGIGQGKGKPE